MNAFTPDEMRRQLEATLQSLKASGIEWLPKGPPLAMMQHTAPNAPAPSTAESSPVEENMPRASQPQRLRELDVIRAEVAKCTRCKELAISRTHTVFSDGDPNAELCFIGEAPGADEDAQGLPFVGAAGQLLNKIIVACGMKREDVYICNVIKCRPPQNRTPLPNEAANCREYLERQLELVKPKFIVCLGATAATHLLGTTKPLGQLRGTFHDYKGIQVLVTYHPAYLLPHRNPAKKKDVWEDMKMLLTKMGRAIPAT